MDCEQSPAMMFASPAIRLASSAIRFAQGWITGWLRDDCTRLLNQDRSATEIIVVQRTAKGGLC